MPPSCALFGGFAIGARVALLHGNVTRTRNVSEYILHDCTRCMPSYNSYGTAARRRRGRHLDGIVGEVVVQYHVSDVTEHLVTVVPVAVEAQHVPVMVEKLLQRVHRVVRTQRLLGLLHLHPTRHRSITVGCVE